MESVPPSFIDSWPAWRGGSCGDLGPCDEPRCPNEPKTHGRRRPATGDHGEDRLLGTLKLTHDVGI